MVIVDVQYGQLEVGLTASKIRARTSVDAAVGSRATPQHVGRTVAADELVVTSASAYGVVRPTASEAVIAFAAV